MRYIILTILFCLNAHSQSDKINYIEFNYSHSWQAFSTKIIIDRPIEKGKPITLKACVGEKCRDTILSKDNFDRICYKLMNISPRDLISSFEEGGDGAMTVVKFGDYTNEISYTLWGVYKEDMTLKTVDFINAAQLILEAAKLKIEDIN